MEEYSEDILRKIGPRSRGIIVIGEMQMKRLGYFLLTIEPNLKYNKKKKIRRY
jgi:hypothetical protein